MKKKPTDHHHHHHIIMITTIIFLNINRCWMSTKHDTASVVWNFNFHSRLLMAMWHFLVWLRNFHIKRHLAAFHSKNFIKIFVDFLATKVLLEDRWTIITIPFHSIPSTRPQNEVNRPQCHHFLLTYWTKWSFDLGDLLIEQECLLNSAPSISDDLVMLTIHTINSREETCKQKIPLTVILSTIER